MAHRLNLSLWTTRAVLGIALLAGIMVLRAFCRCLMQCCSTPGHLRLRRSAIDVLDKADMCILVLGTDGHWECEGWDQPHLRLPGEQNELASEILDLARKQQKKVVVVLNVGSP